MSTHDHPDHEHGGPGYASPQVAREQPPEQFAYVAALYEGTGIDRPDFVAVVDVDPSSPSYGEIVHRTEMPNVGDELHHFGWNAVICPDGELPVLQVIREWAVLGSNQ